MKTYTIIDLENVAKVINSLDPTNPQDLCTLLYLETRLSLKQDALISGVNIKTINNQNLLGAGNIPITTLEDHYSATTPTILRDDFLTGNAETGELGSLLWNFVNGSVTTINNAAGESNHPGILRRSSSTTNNQVCTMFTGRQVNTQLISFSDLHKCTWIVRFPIVSSNHSIRIGFSSDFNSNTPTQALWFRKLNTQTDWEIVSRSASLESSTLTGVTVTANTWYKLEFVNNTSSVDYYIDNTLVGTINTNIPTTGLFAIGNSITNNTNAAFSMDIDFFSLLTTNLVR